VAGSCCTAGAPERSAPDADCPVIYSRRSQGKPESDELRRPCTELSSERRRTVQCCAVSTFSLILCLSSFDSFGLYLAESPALRQKCLAYKTIYKASRLPLFFICISLILDTHHLTTICVGHLITKIFIEMAQGHISLSGCQSYVKCIHCQLPNGSHRSCSSTT
jgi:hypothetical protein